MRVYVTTRYCDDLTLTLGVFTELDAAKEYVEEVATVRTPEWREPRPGSQYWELHGGLLTYTVEEHCVR